MSPISIFMQSTRIKKIKINRDPNVPVITEKELLANIPPHITYSAQTHYDFFNHGKSRFPSKVFHWNNFTEMVKNHNIDDVLKKYERPKITLGHAPVSTKEELTQIIEIQIINALTSKLNHDDIELCKLAENLLIDWNVVNNCDQVLASIALRTRRVLRLKEDDVIQAYRQNTGDFADNINEVYDYMCELGLKYSILTTYEYTWFLKRSEDDNSILLISPCQRTENNDPTILQSCNYLLHLSKNEPLMLPCPTVIKEIDYFRDDYLDYDSETFSGPSHKRLYSGSEEGNFEIKRFRHDESMLDGSLHHTNEDDNIIRGIMNWNKVIIKNEIGNSSNGIIYLVEYNGEELEIKFTERDDWRRADLEKEARIYKRLSNLQGIHIPQVKYIGFTLKGEKYVFATEHIKKTSRLLQRHKEKALNAIKEIHSAGIIHMDICESNFIVGHIDDKDEERVFVIGFYSSKDFKDEQHAPIASYHIYMESEKKKVENLFTQLQY
ncbi:12696_t:CDS:1 [Funneliformis geosporum]|uniref:13415_t:CDS:1 n=1 Tax=Funneliformis geosporum TaxID=1117311 RepID=A0A9W4SY95_9GLOM|nr:12696_t:CDS:1 [Funneliformis geosporum]CAI2186037.1 13415_t:CDS:1 [Funneliformis geosporum]